MAAFDAKKFRTNDWGVVGAGAVAFIGLFFDAYKVKFKGSSGLFSGVSGSLSGWHFKGLWLGVLFLVLAAAFVVVKVQGLLDLPTLPIGPKLAVLTATSIGTLIILIRVFTYPDVKGSGIDSGAAFGSWLILIAAIVAVVFAALDFKDSGEDLSDFRNFTGGDSTPPAAS